MSLVKTLVCSGRGVRQKGPASPDLRCTCTMPVRVKADNADEGAIAPNARPTENQSAGSITGKLQLPSRISSRGSYIRIR